MSRVVGIVAFKGGVGKSTVVINLGVGLVKLDKRVLIVDGNFLSPNLHLYLGLLEPSKTLKDVVGGKTDIRNAIYSHRSGIDLLPCSFYKDVDFKGFQKMIDGVRKKYDFVIVDSGPSYTSEIVAVLASCDEIVGVATPDYTTIASTVRLMKFAKFKDVKIRGIVLNRVRKKRFEVSRRDIEKTVGARVIGEIREDVKVGKAGKEFGAVVGKRWSRAGKGFLKLARKFL